MAGPAPAQRVPPPGQVGWPYGLELRARAVGLVGVGRPVREVARLVGVHPGTVRRWVRQATRRWADPVDTVDAEDEQDTDPDTDAG
jgi:transposase-like protein